MRAPRDAFTTLPATPCKTVNRHTGLADELLQRSDFNGSQMPLRNMMKDLDIVQAAAKEVDLSLPAVSAAQKLHADAVQEGYADWDMAVPYVLLGRSEKDRCGPRLGVSDDQWGF